MPFTTFSRSLRSWLLSLLVVATGLASSCQSSRPDFSFQPIPSQPVAARPLPITATTAQPAVADSARAVATTAALVAVAAPHRTNLLRQPHLALAAPIEQAISAPNFLKITHLHRKTATHGTAENGLGSIGLFAIAVVLVVLVGLALLVSLIPGVGFFAALGYTVGGLVVLGLLYRLFSNKKK